MNQLEWIKSNIGDRGGQRYFPADEHCFDVGYGAGFSHGDSYCDGYGTGAGHGDGLSNGYGCGYGSGFGHGDGLGNGYGSGKGNSL